MKGKASGARKKLICCQRLQADVLVSVFS